MQVLHSSRARDNFWTDWNPVFPKQHFPLAICITIFVLIKQNRIENIWTVFFNDKLKARDWMWKQRIAPFYFFSKCTSFLAPKNPVFLLNPIPFLFWSSRMNIKHNGHEHNGILCECRIPQCPAQIPTQQKTLVSHGNAFLHPLWIWFEDRTIVFCLDKMNLWYIIRYSK